MATKNRQGIGGPKTQRGKLQSSKNSFKHGLTSSAPSSDHEAQLIASITKELVAFYKPQSPLEHIQINRIALYKAKLSHLYEIEQTRLALAHKELDLHPEKILEKISGAVGIAKTMALEIIEEQRISAIHGLTTEILTAIVNETQMFVGVVNSIHEFKKTFPLLSKYLASIAVTGLNGGDRLPEKLFAIVGRVDGYLSLEGDHHEKFENYFYYQNLGMQYEVLINKYGNTGFEKEIADHQKESRTRHGLPEKDLAGKFVQKNIPDFLSTKVLTANFRVLQKLLVHMKKAEKIATQFFELKELMSQSITLPASESDLLMRYQTTFERRLSSAIDQLLELQKMASR